MSARSLRSGVLLAGLVAAAGAIAADPAGSSGAAAPALPASASAAPNRPPADCLAMLDKLSQGIPRDETGPALRSKGLRIATPIAVPERVLSAGSVVSGARVRVMIDSKGRVVPGSVTVQQASGDPKLPLVLSDAVPASLSFDVGGAFSVPKEFAFTTVYVVCAKR